jgi:hypothetical protein
VGRMETGSAILQDSGPPALRGAIILRSQRNLRSCYRPAP